MSRLKLEHDFTATKPALRMAASDRTTGWAALSINPIGYTSSDDSDDSEERERLATLQQFFENQLMKHFEH